MMKLVKNPREVTPGKLTGYETTGSDTQLRNYRNLQPHYRTIQLSHYLSPASARTVITNSSI